MNNPIKNPTVLITGASSGFGLEFAKIFARAHCDLILIARPRGTLSTIAKEIEKKYSVNVSIYEVDLSKPSAADDVYNWVKKNNLKVNYLINNVGVGYYGKFIKNPLKKERELLQLNIVLLTELCHKFIPDMIKEGKGKVLNIASLAAFQSGPYYATYFASKAYVLLFTEALALEHKDDDIIISALCPGPAKTQFFKNAKMTETSYLLKSAQYNAKYIAETGYKGLMSGKKIIIPGLRAKVISQSYRILPRHSIGRITKALIETAAKG